VIAVLLAVLSFLFGARVATCPPGTWLDGVRALGGYECISLAPGDVAESDSMPIVVTSGRLYCAADERAIYLHPRRAECRRINPIQIARTEP
jgi:hypothetical protein